MNCASLKILSNPTRPGKAVNGLVQAGLAYMKSVELTNLEARLSRLEERQALGELSYHGHP